MESIPLSPAKRVGCGTRPAPLCARRRRTPGRGRQRAGSQRKGAVTSSVHKGGGLGIFSLTAVRKVSQGPLAQRHSLGSWPRGGPPLITLLPPEGQSSLGAGAGWCRGEVGMPSCDQRAEGGHKGRGRAGGPGVGDGGGEAAGTICRGRITGSDRGLVLEAAHTQHFLCL